MLRARAKSYKCNTKCDTAAAGNDNNQPPSNAVTLTELASAMQLDEDVLLQRLATILHKREDAANADVAGEPW
jgi:hypothetical protein